MSTVDINEFKVTREDTLPASGSSSAKLDNIHSLIQSGLSALEIAHKTYNGKIPHSTSLMVSPEGDDTLDKRMLVRFNQYVRHIQRIIDEQGKGA